MLLMLAIETLVMEGNDDEELVAVVVQDTATYN